MKRILLCDFMGSAFYHHHAKETNLQLSFTKNMREIIRSYKVDRTVILQEGGSTFRESILPTYKEVRKKRREKQTEAEKAAYQKFLKDTEDLSGILSLLGCISLKVYGAEADDLAGYLCSALPTEEYQLLLLTEDSDWSQLLERPNTVIGSYKAMVGSMPDLSSSLWLNGRSFTEAKGLTPAQWFEKKLLSGDTSDSIPGIEGLGDTGAFRLIEKYGSLEGVKQNSDNLEIPRLAAKAKAGLKDCDDLLNLGYRLMNLRWTEAEWEELLPKKDRHKMQRVRQTIFEPWGVDTASFTELCYERGWLDCLDPQWLEPFQKNLSA